MSQSDPLRDENIYADAGNAGLRFILPSPLDATKGGLSRGIDDGHLSAIVGRGGSGKSMFALQILTGLLNEAKPSGEKRSPAAFYFTLEASPDELCKQIGKFKWGQDRYKDEWKAEGNSRFSNGLYVIDIPSPVASLVALNLQIRQSIARKLSTIGPLVAIVIDPMGALDTGGDLRASFTHLKELAETHCTFVFALTERYVFDANPAIEHYSQSIIHLEYDPDQQHHRRLYIQKARGQSFRSGYHRFELQPPRIPRRNPADQADALDKQDYLSEGIRVFPSVDAQSAYAHDKLAESQAIQNQIPVSSARKAKNSLSTTSANLVPFFSKETNSKVMFLNKSVQIAEGSSVFLMGPPGTFKEWIAGEFAKAGLEHDDGATIYVSFKADFQTIRESQESAQSCDFREDLQQPLRKKIYFFDARSPLLTPEEVLFTVKNAIDPTTSVAKLVDRSKIKFRRAVIWGLRRLYDFPNFNADRAVQFLEALVTLLKSRRITSLLVDWPDKQTPSTVPIVDLCQHIFLTRVCVSKESPSFAQRLKDCGSEEEKDTLRKELKNLWMSETEKEPAKQVSLLRAQRTSGGVFHNQGAILRQVRNRAGRFEIEQWSLSAKDQFERAWLYFGAEWEQDLSLLS